MPQSANISRTRSFAQLLKRFMPGLLPLVCYQRSDLRHDFIAGCSVAAVALPVGIAYASVAGMPPVYGIYASLLPLFAYALFGSSRQLIIGPDAATCLMAASAIAPLAGGDPQRYMELMVSITLITGLLNIVFGLCRFGFMANFLSHPILIGYLNGVALIVLTGQLPDLFGYQGGGKHFWNKILDFFDKVPTAHIPTFLLGAAAIGILLGLKRWAPRLPAPLIVAGFGIIAVYLLHLSGTNIAVLGAVPTGFPALHMPSFDPTRFEVLVQHATGIALISFVSGIMTAKSFARRNRYGIDANQELIAFGVCNIVTGLAQGFPVTGADSRTAVNSAMGGRTQLAGIVAGGVMLLFLLFFTAPLALLPTAVLAAIIAVSCLGLFDFAALRELYAASKRELAFSLVTTASVLYFDVLPAVSFAVIFTFLWLLLAASHPRDAVLGQVPDRSTFHSIADYPNAVTVPGLLLYRFEGNVLFFNSDYFKNRLLYRITAAKAPVKWVVIDASPISMIDITALHNLLDLREELRERGIQLKFARVRRSLRNFFDIHWVANNPLLNEDPRYDSLTVATEAFAQWERGLGSAAGTGP